MNTAMGRRAARVLAVLAVVLGLLTMHGLVGGHHGTAPIAVAGAAGGAADSSTGHSAAHGSSIITVWTAQQGMAQAVAAATAPVHDLAGGCDGECSDRPTGLLLLCVAVLLAAGAALARGLGTMTWRTTPATGPPSGRLVMTAPIRRLDPVADLCISRT